MSMNCFCDFSIIEHTPYTDHTGDTDHADDDDDDGDADRFESSSYIDMMISAVDGGVVDRVGMHWWGVVDNLSVGRSDRYDDRADGTDVDDDDGDDGGVESSSHVDMMSLSFDSDVVDRIGMH